MLVVVLIIGIIANFAVLSLGGRALDDRLDTEARRLEQVLRLALEEAEIKGVEIGFRHTDAGYHFIARDNEGQWQDYAQSGVLRPRNLPDPFFIELRVEGRAVPPAQEVEGEDRKLEPQVLLLSSGELTPFSLDLKAPRHPLGYRLQGDALGKLVLERQADTPS